MRKKRHKKARVLSSFEKGLRVLDAIVPAPRGRTLTELANDVRIARADLFPYLNTLVKSGWVFKGRCNGIRYFIAREKKDAFINSADRMNILVSNLSMEGLERLHKKYGENFLVAMRRYGRVVFVATALSAKDKVVFNVFPDHSLQFSAAGRAILAYEDAETIDKYLYEAPYEMYSTYSIANRKLLEAALEKTRRDGVAVCDKESGDGFCAVAVPIFKDGRVVASLTAQLATRVYAPAESAPLIADLRAEAEKISKAL